MNDNYINFRRQRELGEIISDTFKFIRENYKLLFRLIFKIAGPVFVVLVLAMGYYYYVVGYQPLMSNIFDFRPGEMILALILMLVSFLGFFALLQGTIFHYIKSYVENNGDVNPLQVRTGVKSDFGKILGVTLMTGVLIFIGLMLCILPGIYLWVPLSFAIPLVVFGRRESIDSIKDAFELIRDNWWMTFISLFIMALLMYLVSLIFQIPMFIYIFIKAFTVVQEGSAASPEMFIDWVYIVFSVISSLAQYLLYTILIIAIAFIYYSLDEKKNATGSLDTISNLGSSDID